MSLPSGARVSRALGAVATALALTTTLFLGACGKKSNSVTGPGAGGTGTLNGKVTLVASAGSPVAGATVTASSGAATATDAGGQFALTIPAGQDVRVDVTKAGFTLNQMHVRLSSHESRVVSVGLMAAGNTATVQVASGGSVTDPTSAAKITLPANFVTATGPVSVSITGLDPTTDQISALPGGLEAVDGTGATKYLKPVSFAEYTVRDAAGHVLPYNTAASAGANIELPIPASLRGQPGYANGDPIECYVYDPADGKWKTPVPGVIGPSSVDGQPAIKATIFHLSWYGGAPATSDVACVSGTVRDSIGNPVAGASVEAFQGAKGTTDASGHFQIEAAAHSQVRVVASRLVGNVFQSATDTVQTAGAGDACASANLVMKSEHPSFDVTATMLALPGAPDPGYSVSVQIMLGTPETAVPVEGAVVEVGTGGTFTTIPESGSGSYDLFSFSGPSPLFPLVAGAPYTLRLDYNHDGIVDATGLVHMAGIPVVVTPDSGSVQPRSFTANWTDDGTGSPGYIPLYIGINGGGEGNPGATASIFITTATSKTIGSGVTDPTTYLPDPPLVAGPYQLSLLNFVGPLVGGALPNLPSTPNVSGPGTTGIFNAYSISDAVPYTSTGAALAARNTSAPIAAAARARAAKAVDATIERLLGKRFAPSTILARASRASRSGRMASHVRR